ncbi:hypothetical protein H4S14_002223 [Agrobacterium vitis]|nr:hypothetical protein [Agrobacterium vitis]MBE1438476.1 hypothetical protein [Agrobacterium vitis]
MIHLEIPLHKDIPFQQIMENFFAQPKHVSERRLLGLFMFAVQNLYHAQLLVLGSFELAEKRFEIKLTVETVYFCAIITY